MRTVKSLIVLWRTFIPGLRRARTRKRSVKGGTLNIPSVLWSRKQRTEIGKALRREWRLGSVLEMSVMGNKGKKRILRRDRYA